MSAFDRQHDPELLEILGEMAADPNSMLLEMAATKSMTGRGLYDRPISVGESFLTNAEKRMLERHREEMARLLYDACRLAMGAMSVRETGIVWAKSGLSLNSWKASASRELAAQSEGASEEVQMINSLLVGVSKSGVPVDLCRAALRLHPSNQTRNLLILALRKSGRIEEALQLVDQMLRLDVFESTSRRAVAHSNRAYVLGSGARKEEAREAWREASLLDSCRAHYYCWWFIFELRRGVQRCIEECAQILNEHVDEADPLGLDCISVLRDDVTSGRWEPTSDYLALVPSIRDRLTGVSRAIAHALP